MRDGTVRSHTRRHPVTGKPVPVREHQRSFAESLVPAIGETGKSAWRHRRGLVTAAGAAAFGAGAAFLSLPLLLAGVGVVAATNHEKLRELNQHAIKPAIADIASTMREPKEEPLIGGHEPELLNDIDAELERLAESDDPDALETAFILNGIRLKHEDDEERRAEEAEAQAKLRKQTRRAQRLTLESYLRKALGAKTPEDRKRIAAGVAGQKAQLQTRYPHLGLKSAARQLWGGPTGVKVGLTESSLPSAPKTPSPINAEAMAGWGMLELIETVLDGLDEVASAADEPPQF